LVDDWSRYIAKNQRAEIRKKTERSDSLRASGLTGADVKITWVTEQAACVLISERIDKERLSKDQAEAEYKKLRLSDAYVFHYRLKVAGHPLAPPIKDSGLILESVADRNSFSRGRILSTEQASQGLLATEYIYYSLIS
jgi:hypothetical protein